MEGASMIDVQELFRFTFKRVIAKKPTTDGGGVGTPTPPVDRLRVLRTVFAAISSVSTFVNINI
jgi:hypothetical protein